VFIGALLFFCAELYTVIFEGSGRRQDAWLPRVSEFFGGCLASRVLGLKRRAE
jgi:hypothetical protein